MNEHDAIAEDIGRIGETANSIGCKDKFAIDHCGRQGSPLR